MVWNLTSKQNCVGLFHCPACTQRDTVSLASINRPNSCARYSHGLQDLRKTYLFKKKITRIPNLCGFFFFLRGSFQCLLNSFHSSEVSTTQSATRLKLQKILGGQLLFPYWPVFEGWREDRLQPEISDVQTGAYKGSWLVYSSSYILIHQMSFFADSPSAGLYNSFLNRAESSPAASVDSFAGPPLPPPPLPGLTQHSSAGQDGKSV